MKIIYLVIIILLTITTISIIGYNLIKDKTNDLSSTLLELKKAAENGDWSKVESNKETMLTKWNYLQNILPLMVDHAEYHDLDLAIARITMFINSQQKRDLIPEIAVAQTLLKQIPEQEKLSLKNIF